MINDNTDAPGQPTVHNNISRKHKRPQNRDIKAATENNISRLLEKTYIGFKKENQAAKKVFCIERSRRNLLGKCDHEGGDNFKCYLVSEEVRCKTFNEYWKLESWLVKKSFVRGLVASRSPNCRQKILKMVNNKPNAFVRGCYLANESGNKV